MERHGFKEETPFLQLESEPTPKLGQYPFGAQSSRESVHQYDSDLADDTSLGFNLNL